MFDPSIPAEFPLEELVNQELTQISIGSGNVGLAFFRSTGILDKWEPGASIMIDAGFELSKDGEVICTASGHEFGHNAGELTALLRRQVVAVARLAKNKLLVSFSDSYRLKLLTDSTGFESYHLFWGEEPVHVSFGPENQA